MVNRHNTQRVDYSFGVVLANMRLEPFDERAEAALESLTIIMDELDIGFQDYSVLNGFANSKDILIKEAKNELKVIKKLVDSSK